MQDALPRRALARQALVDAIRAAYELHGFAPLVTPAIEAMDVLVGPGGAAANQQIFRVDSGEDDALGLRFDLTVPLARVVAQHEQELPRPFRRYQVGSVWRIDKPGVGRYREFGQFDADIVGTSSAMADAEVLAAAVDALEAAVPRGEGGPRFAIRLSDRRILDVLLTRCGISADRGPDVFRVLDKLDRVGVEKVLSELTTGYVDESGDRVAGLGFDPAAVGPIRDFLAIAAPTRSAVLSALDGFFGSTPGAAEALAAVAELSALLDAFGVTDEIASLDLSIARGLAYYTGPVFELALLGAGHVGSVGGGGRYDDLVGRFSGQPWPGVGISIGVDRLLAALDALAVAGETASTPAEVLVTTMDRTRAGDYVRMAQELRRAGVRTELFCGTSANFGKQVRHADRLQVPVVVIAGSDEFARGVVTVKQMDAAPRGVASREEWLAARFGQREVPRGGLVACVLEALGRGERR